MLVEEFERAKQNPDDNSSFAYHLESIFNSIEEEGGLFPGTEDEIEEIDELPTRRSHRPTSRGRGFRHPMCTKERF